MAGLFCVIEIGAAMASALLVGGVVGFAVLLAVTS
jgi:hypothetical protein